MHLKKTHQMFSFDCSFDLLLVAVVASFERFESRRRQQNVQVLCHHSAVELINFMFFTFKCLLFWLGKKFDNSRSFIAKYSERKASFATFPFPFLCAHIIYIMEVHFLFHLLLFLISLSYYSQRSVPRPVGISWDNPFLHATYFSSIFPGNSSWELHRPCGVKSKK